MSADDFAVTGFRKVIFWVFQEKFVCFVVVEIKSDEGYQIGQAGIRPSSSRDVFLPKAPPKINRWVIRAIIITQIHSTSLCHRVDVKRNRVTGE